MPAVFLDRDGVINRKRPPGEYVTSWQEFEFLPGAAEAIRLLKQSGFRVVVVTNQRGISLGKMRESDLEFIHRRMAQELRQSGAVLDAIYYCPHDNNACQCRKPALGLFFAAQRDFPDIRFAESVVIGDSASDMQAGERLGCKKKILIATGETQTAAARNAKLAFDFAAPSLLEAVQRHLLPPSPQ